jgi:hypothetical protein
MYHASPPTSHQLGLLLTTYPSIRIHLSLTRPIHPPRHCYISHPSSMLRKRRAMWLKKLCTFAASLVTSLLWHLISTRYKHTLIPSLKMKTVYKRTALLGTFVLVGLMATVHDFTTLTHQVTSPRFHPVATSYQTSLFNPQPPASDISTRIPRPMAVTNTTLAGLQEGILGNSIAEGLKLPSKR